MRLLIEGLDVVEIGGGPVGVLEVHDKRLFARVCRSLISEQGEAALEPYSLWDAEGGKLSARNAILAAVDPFDLPWGDRALLGDLQDVVEEMYAADDQARRRIDESARRLREDVVELGLRLQSEYEFAVEWDLGKFLKSFDFSVEEDPVESLLDNLIKFMKFASDIRCKQVILFVNLKSFLEKSELEEFYREAFLCDLNILLLESIPDPSCYEQERKTVIDLDFLSE